MKDSTSDLVAAFIRVIGITCFLDMVREISHLPEEFVYLAQGGIVTRTALVVTTALVFRCMLDIVLSLVFWYRASSLARLVNKGLSAAPGIDNSG